MGRTFIQVHPPRKKARNSSSSGAALILISPLTGVKFTVTLKPPTLKSWLGGTWWERLSLLLRLQQLRQRQLSGPISSGFNPCPRGMQLGQFDIYPGLHDNTCNEQRHGGQKPDQNRQGDAVLVTAR